MSFISSGNRSTPILWLLGSLIPEVGATPTEAIGLKSFLISLYFHLDKTNHLPIQIKIETKRLALEQYFKQYKIIDPHEEKKYI